MIRNFKENDIVRHFKGNYYIVRGIAINTETEETVVIYQALHGSCKTYVTDYKTFSDKVDKIEHPYSTQAYVFDIQGEIK